MSIRPDFRRVTSRRPFSGYSFGWRKKNNAIDEDARSSTFNPPLRKERRESLELIVPRRIFRENRSHFTDRENGVTPFSFESRLRYNTSADDGYKRQRVPPPIHPFVFQFDTTSQWIFSCEIGQRKKTFENLSVIREIYSYRRKRRCWKNFLRGKYRD